MKYPARLIHLSTDNLDGRTLHPRIPESRLEDEDSTTSRVCFSSGIAGAIRAMGRPSFDNILYVHIPSEPVRSLAPIRPTVAQVPDGRKTREWWVTRPVTLKCIGRISVSPLYDGQYRYVGTPSDNQPASRSVTALRKILRLIGTGIYGGRVTQEDWDDLSRPVYTIYQDRRSRKKNLYVGKTSVRTQIAFHTREQARLFLTHHPDLIRQYMNA